MNVSLSAAYEEGTLVAQATLSLAVRYVKKPQKIKKKNLVNLILYKKKPIDDLHCHQHLSNFGIIFMLLYQNIKDYFRLQQTDLCGLCITLTVILLSIVKLP